MAPLPSGTSPAGERRRHLGRRGEEAAVRWYVGAGYEVVGRNWRCAEGEIDVIAIAPGGSMVAICEVKTRSSTAYGLPQEAVTGAKQRRLRRLAARWLAQQRTHGAPVRAVRFDVVGVLDAGSPDLVVEVVLDAF